MRVLVACEFSGRVRDAFLALGHDAYSCDIYPTRVPGPHLQGDVEKYLGNGWDLMIAHPPCTHLACSGAKHFKQVSKQLGQLEALRFFRALLNAPIAKIAVENPVGIANTRIRPPDQIIQPYQFGDPYRKTTCLWLKGLSLLEATEIVAPKLRTFPCGATFSVDYHSIGSNFKVGRSRSVTYIGIAQAMASQWGAE